MITRKQAAEGVFRFIKEIGYKVYDINYGDGYFIFDMGQDSVVHFKIKGLRGWQFAMWIETDPEELKQESEVRPAVQLFCQHKDNIDKFKPSRSHFLIELSLEDTTDEEYICGEYEIEQMLGMIKRHPLMAYVMDEYGYGKYFDCYFIPTYTKAKLQTWKYKFQEWCEDWIPYVWTKAKMLIIKRNRIIESMKLIDGDGDGWKSYPRFELQILFKENSTDEDEVKFLNRWFKRDDYWNLRVDYGRVGLEPYRYERVKK